MIEIRNLAFLDKNKLKSLGSFVESDLDFSAFYPFPLDFLHQFLPFKFKFLGESFAAIQDKVIKGLITVNKAETRRVKITRLLLNENSFESGKLLVNCVLAMFVSCGAESFYVITDKTNTPLTTMFTDGCGFKNTAFERVYKINRKDMALRSGDVNFEHIRKMALKDAKEVEILINSTIYSYQRPSFYKNAGTLKKKILTGQKQYVIFDRRRGEILGYFTLSKLNKTNYSLEFVIIPLYEGYSPDLIKYVMARLYCDKNFKSLYVKLKSYCSNFNELSEILEFEYKCIQENAILTKNFAVAKNKFTYEKMIFNDATPAF